MSSEAPRKLGQRVLQKPDYLLLGSMSALLLIGALMVYSASFVVAHNEFNDDTYFLTRQLAWMCVGAVALAVGVRVDYRRWRSWTLAMMIVSIAMLLLVLAPGIGSSSYGAVRWIRIGPFLQLQPSEIAKLALVIYLADWLARRGALVRQIGKGLLPFGIIVMIVAALVEIQPDLGTTAIIVGTAACVFFVAGANLLHIGLLLASGVGGAVLFISRMSGYRQDRITAFLDPWSDIQGSGWHTAQGLIALGSGGFFGMGLGNSHAKFYWIPNAHTDAIFAIIGEELGFLGCLVVLGLFGLLAWRGYLIAWRAPDAFGRLLAIGLTSMLLIQALVNVAVITNSIPYTGITLPFVSFGGNSTVISMLAVGFLLNVSRHRGNPTEQDLAPTPMARSVSAPVASQSARLPRLAPSPALGARSGLFSSALGPTVRGFSHGGPQARPVRNRTPRGRAGRPRRRGFADGY